MKRTDEQKKIRRSSRVKALRAGGYSSFAIVVVILIAVMANLAVGALPSSVTKLDYTQQSIYSLSEQTKRIVSQVETPVTLTLIATKGQEDATVKTLLDRYKSLSSMIKVEIVDPTVTPGILKKYENEDLRQNSVIVASDTRDRFVSYSEIYVYNYTMNYQTYDYDYTVDFGGENALTSAIHYVTSAELPKIYTLTGHGEAKLTDSVLSLIKNDNMQTEELSLLTVENIPDDADCIIISIPTGDISRDEASMLTQYLDAGGNILLNTGYISNGEMPNLMSVASHMGVTAKDGIVVETDSGKFLRGYNYYLLPTVNSHEITDSLIYANLYALMPISQGIATEEGTAATVTPLMTTSDGAYAKVAGYDMETTDKEEGDADGPFDIAVASELGEAKLTWFASEGMLTDDVNSMVSGGNYDVLMNSLNWMCDKSESISIRAKSLDEEQLTVSDAQAAAYSALLVGIVPLVILGLGIVIWYRRKRA